MQIEKYMEILAKQISKLLFEHDCVIVPGLGGFITNYKPAVIHPHHHTFYPPSKQIIFNSALSSNDGILINAYADNLDINFSEAKKIIDQKVHSIRITLLKGQKVLIEDIGYLDLNRENNIEFTPINTVNYLGEAYGLGRFDFAPVNRVSNTPIIGISRPVVRKTMRWAAIVVPVVALAIWATFNTGTLNRFYGNYASLMPNTTESAKVTATPSKVNSTKTANIKVIKEAPEIGTPAVNIENTVNNTVPVKSAATLGTNPVESKVIIEGTNQSLAESSISYHVIVGAFSIPENASKFVEQLKSDGYHASLIGQNRKMLHLVSIQRFSDPSTAAARLSDLHTKGFPSAWILEKAN